MANYFPAPKSSAILDLLNNAQKIQPSIQMPQDIDVQRGQAMEDFFKSPERTAAYEKAMTQTMPSTTPIDTSGPILRPALSGEAPPSNIFGMIKNVSLDGKNFIVNFWRNLNEEAAKNVQSTPDLVSASDKMLNDPMRLEMIRGVASTFGFTNPKTEISDTTAGRIFYTAGRAFGQTVQMMSLEPVIGNLAFKISKALGGLSLLNESVARFIINGIPRALAWGARGSFEETGREILNHELSPGKIAVAGLKEMPFGLISAVSGASSQTINRIVETGAAYGGYEAFVKILEDHKIDKKDIPDIVAAVAIGALLTSIDAERTSRILQQSDMDDWTFRQGMIRYWRGHPDATEEEAKFGGALWLHGLKVPSTPPAIIQELKSATSLEQIDSILKDNGLTNLQDVFQELQQVPVDKVVNFHTVTDNKAIRVLIDKIQELSPGLYQTINSGVKTPNAPTGNVNTSSPSEAVSNVVSDISDKLKSIPSSQKTQDVKATLQNIRDRISQLEQKVEVLSNKNDPTSHTQAMNIANQIANLKNTLADYEKTGQLSKSYESLSKNINTTPQYNIDLGEDRTADITNKKIIPEQNTPVMQNIRDKILQLEQKVKVLSNTKDYNSRIQARNISYQIGNLKKTLADYERRGQLEKTYGELSKNIIATPKYNIDLGEDRTANIMNTILSGQVKTSKTQPAEELDEDHKTAAMILNNIKNFGQVAKDLIQKSLTEYPVETLRHEKQTVAIDGKIYPRKKAPRMTINTVSIHNHAGLEPPSYGDLILLSRNFKNEQEYGMVILGSETNHFYAITMDENHTDRFRKFLQLSPKQIREGVVVNTPSTVEEWIKKFYEFANKYGIKVIEGTYTPPATVSQTAETKVNIPKETPTQNQTTEQNVAPEEKVQPATNVPDQDVINLIREIDIDYNYGNSVPTWEVIPAMVKKFKISKEEAEKIILDLDDKEIIHLQRYDNPSILPEKLRQYLIPWKDGSSFGHITIRGVLQSQNAQETQQVKTKIKKPRADGMPNIVHRKMPVEKYYTKEVQKRHGIRPYRDGKGKREYTDGVPIFLRNSEGLPPDEMADELGFSNEAELYKYLQAENEAKPETFDTVSASELQVGDTFKIHGELFKVVRKTPEYTYLQDGERIEVRNDETIDFDTGTFDRNLNQETKATKKSVKAPKNAPEQPAENLQPVAENEVPNIKMEEPSNETITVNPEEREKDKEKLNQLIAKEQGLSELTQKMANGLQMLYSDNRSDSDWVKQVFGLNSDNNTAIEELDKMLYKREQELKGVQDEITSLRHKLGSENSGFFKARPGFLKIDPEEAKSGLKQTIDKLKQMLNPQSTKEGRDFATLIEQHRIETNWAIYKARVLAEQLRKMGGSRKYLEIVDSYLDNPEKYQAEFDKLPENYKTLYQALKDAYDELYKLASQYGLVDDFIQNYVPHIYTDDPAKVYKLLFPVGGKLGRKFSFGMEREIPTEDEAIKLGLHPLKDPILKLEIYLIQMYKTIANKKLYEELTTTPTSLGLPLLSPEPKDETLDKVWLEEYKGVNVPSFGMGHLRAHPAIADTINDIFSPYQSISGLEKEYAVLSGAVKKALLINPAYHTWNLLTVLFNEINFSPKALAKLFGVIPQDVTERAIKAGLEITKYSNAIREQLYMELKKTTLLDQALSPIIWLEEKSDKLLWDKIFPQFQLVAFDVMSKAVLKQHPDWTQEQADKVVADELNIVYGTIPKSWTSQLARRYGPLALLTYKWNMAVFDPLLKSVAGGRGIGSGVFPEWEKKYMKKRMRGFVLKSLLAFFLIGNIVQITALFVTNKLKEMGILKGKIHPVRFMFDNESGHKLDLDVGFTAADGSIDYIPLPFYKNVRDWIGMVTNFNKTVYKKVAPIPKVIFENLINYSGWKQAKIVPDGETKLRGAWDRLTYSLSQMLPTSYYTEQPGEVKTNAEWALPALGMWVSRGLPGGDVEKLFLEFQDEQKLEKDRIRIQALGYLKSNQTEKAISFLYKNGYTENDIIDILEQYKMPVAYFWNKMADDKKIQFLQFMKLHKKSINDIVEEVRKEINYAKQGLP